MKKKIKEDKDYIILKNKICDNHNGLWCPNINCSFEKKKTESWYDLHFFENNVVKNNIPYFNIEQDKDNKKVKEQMKSICVDVILNSEQKIIIDRWFKAYILMYNATLKLIKERYVNKYRTILNYKTLRTTFLKNVRDKIIEDSQLPIKKNTKIMTHIMDTAIRLACSNYKSALTNLKRGHIRHFRIRKWKIIKDANILVIEPCYFTQGSLCPKILGMIECYYNGEKFDLSKIGKEYNSECILLYERNLNKYSLLVPTSAENNIKTHNKSFISLDPGIRTFMTGISENEIIKIGDNCQDRIKRLLKKKDKLESYKIKNKKIKKKIRNLHYKLKNLITDMHWKSINYLTNNYKTILIGDLSFKRISNKKTSNIAKMTKRIGAELSFYKYRQRLSYKCKLNNCNYIEVNEKYTSKMCSICGHYKEDLGSNKIYSCNKCKTVIDRDVNGCRNICLKSFK
jgi:IS605 OrfB family transposase